MGDTRMLQGDTYVDAQDNSDEISFQYSVDKQKQGGCNACLARIPYATLIATIMCVLGVVVFCTTMYRGAALAFLMFDHVFKMRLFWVEAVQMSFVIVGACMGAIGFMILTVGCLATGATRYKVYRAWRSRVGGRISCAVFMAITYILKIAWICMFCFLIIITFVFTIFWSMCANPRVANRQDCIEFTQFYFMFPAGTLQERMKICSDQEVKMFCKDYVEKAEIMFIIATAACFLIILSLVHYLMCLAANYAHIRDHEKFQELQDLQYLTDIDGIGMKDRF
ncbi:myelin proteolipid [Holotrichia oblita]|uniref:Myelin proteolipid n=2 Tax=Holotrichia oblita TaxID=644536 RepID=A0ACB9T817_HOLOL|nr:myelin proteolipid [Holotrichia oblita]KAI4462952.1 myelin proteolipid [Holotrichia oblita]